MINGHIIDSFEDFKAYWSLPTRIRTVLKDSIIFVLSLGRSIDHTSDWIRFPYYHHVFNDERRGFECQLDYLRNNGDFLSLDRVIELLERKEPIKGRFFCITFDDGLRSCYDNAFPILAERKIPAAFFIVTENTAAPSVVEGRFCKREASSMPYFYEYLTWSECAEMLKAGMTIGSHTSSHVKLADLNANEVRRQLIESKKAIEEKLGTECKHFACPWGRPGKDFNNRDVNIAKEVGYRSFLTTRRGKNQSGSSPFVLMRDHIHANWKNYQLRYFLSR
jgi:peptidoglycan/xylan/chitin deacetylase (PgdA/CDA1 family)